MIGIDRARSIVSSAVIAAAAVGLFLVVLGGSVVANGLSEVVIFDSFVYMLLIALPTLVAGLALHSTKRRAPYVAVIDALLGAALATVFLIGVQTWGAWAVSSVMLAIAADFAAIITGVGSLISRPSRSASHG